MSPGAAVSLCVAVALIDPESPSAPALETLLLVFTDIFHPMNFRVGLSPPIRKGFSICKISI